MKNEQERMEMETRMRVEAAVVVVGPKGEVKDHTPALLSPLARTVIVVEMGTDL